MHTIQDTIDSVAAQHYPDIEYIIVDGASSDGTLDIIQANAAHIHYWVSEPDQGIYDAMNKGIRLATGDVVAILNSDDFYVHSEVISQVVAHFKRTKADSIYGDLQYVCPYNTQKIVRNWVAGCPKAQFFIRLDAPHPAFL
nr:glycosyltransferase [Haliscomenobacter sp.]